MKLSDKAAQLTLTNNKQSAGLAGEIRAFAGDTSSWSTINGVKQNKNWAVCDGTVLNQADYPQLFANIGGVWNNFAHPVDGVPSVGAGQFALPNLKGLYLGGVGNSGGEARTLGVFQADKTAKNGLETSDSSVAGTTQGSTATWASANITTSSDSHQHTLPFGASIHLPYGSSGTVPNTTWDEKVQNAAEGGEPIPLVSSDTHDHTFNKNLLNTNQNAHTHTFTATATAQALTGDAETRPKTAPVVYIIALYDNLANVISINDFTIKNNVDVGGNIAVAGTVNGNLVGDVNATTISATTYTGLPVASISMSGVVSTGTQSFAGAKTFTSITSSTYNGLPVAASGVSGIMNTSTQTISGIKKFISGVELGDAGIVSISKGAFAVQGSSDTPFSWNANGGHSGSLGIRQCTSGRDRGYLYYNNATGSTVLFYGNDGNLRIGGTTSVSNNGGADGGVVVGTQTSDARIKSNIQDLNIGINTIMQMSPKVYDKQVGSLLKHEIGLLAQDIQSLVPTAVYDTKEPLISREAEDTTPVTEGETILALEYHQLIPVLIKAMQEQQAEIEDLKTRITTLEGI